MLILFEESGLSFDSLSSTVSVFYLLNHTNCFLTPMGII